METTKTIETDTTRTSLHDRFNRPLRDLRISVVDACNLRCTYCMPKERFGERYQFLSEVELLSFDEIARVARLAAELGVEKIRVTGGEPLLRRGLPSLIERLAEIPGVNDIALTTNGILLPRFARPLRDAGLKRVTVSLDTLDDDTMQRISGRKVAVQDVVDGIDAAESAGFSPVKINVVVQKGVNDKDILPLVERFSARGHILRFIEYMDVGTRNHWNREQVVSSAEIVKIVGERFPLEPLDGNYHGEVAERYGFKNGQGEIGLISSVSAPFCGSCTRMRLSADGRFYTCLFGSEGIDVRTLLREGDDDEAVVELIRETWRNRSDRYSELRSGLSSGADADRIEMYQIGG